MNSEIERLAEEAGIVLDYYYVAKDLDVLAKFAALIAEECAKVVKKRDLAAASLYSQRPTGYQDYGQPATASQMIRAKFALSGGEAK